MALQSFKDLLVWQKSQTLITEVYKNFANCRDYGFRDQIQRATVSISNNIAEGYGRRSDRALGHFLGIARGSATEVESMLFAAKNLNYINNMACEELLGELDEISKLITSLGIRS